MSHYKMPVYWKQIYVQTSSRDEIHHDQKWGLLKSFLKGQGHEIRMTWKWYGKVVLNS